MTKQKKPEKNQKHPSKIEKAKGSATLGRKTFIDEIYKKAGSPPSVGYKKVNSKQPASSLQASELPFEAFAEVHSQTEEQDFQEIQILLQNHCRKGISATFVKEKEKQGKPRNQNLPLEQISH